MKQILQNNFWQDWACTFIKCHTVLFTLNLNPTSYKDLGCFYIQRQFLSHCYQVKVETFTKRHAGTHRWFVIWSTRTTGICGTDNAVHHIPPCWATWEFGLWQKCLWFGFVQGQYIGTQAPAEQKPRGQALEGKPPDRRLLVSTRSWHPILMPCKIFSSD